MRYPHPILPVVFALLAMPLSAADNQDPTWPCIQPKVGEISIGQNWPYPPNEEGEAIALDEDGEKLVAILSLRRVTEDDARQYVSEYAEAHPDAQTETYTSIYASLLHNLNLTRAEIISGIARYAGGQQSRAAAIDEKRQAMREEEAKDEPDFDKLDEWEAEIDWDERIYKDRERSLTYVCETPVILEKRAYAMAQILASFVE